MLTLTTVDPMFSSVNDPRLSSSRSPRALTTAAGWTVKTTFGLADVTTTSRTSEGGALFDGSHDGSARTRW